MKAFQITLTYVENRGAAFGIFQNKKPAQQQHPSVQIGLAGGFQPRDYSHHNVEKSTIDFQPERCLYSFIAFFIYFY